MSAAVRRRRRRVKAREDPAGSGVSRRRSIISAASEKKFDAAGISIYAYNYSPNASYTDAEIDRGFEMTQRARRRDHHRLDDASTWRSGSRRSRSSTRWSSPMHGHSNVKRPERVRDARQLRRRRWRCRRYFKINLDIGHFTAANFDALAYIREHHADITNLHLKDRKKNQGDNMPWGEGETPIREVLQLLKKERWPIRAYIEYEYRGAGSPVEEVRKCFTYAKQALA